MTGALWPRVRELFDAVVELPESERAAFLARADVEPEIHAEVERMLRSDGAASGFLESFPRLRFGLPEVVLPVGISAECLPGPRVQPGSGTADPPARLYCPSSNSAHTHSPNHPYDFSTSRSTAQHPRTWGPGERRWPRMSTSAHPASSSASASTPSRAASRGPA